MLNCYCQLSSSVIFRQYGVSQSECKIDRPRPGLPRVSPGPHTEALGTRLGPSFWNPKSTTDLESGIQVVESGIQAAESGIQREESGIQEV